jgi:hypothetical protein
MNLLDSLMDFSCKRFARHVAVGVEVSAATGLYQRAQFWIHCMICPFCRRYWEEIKALGDLQRMSSELAKHPVIQLSELKSRLKQNIQRKFA